MVTITTRTLAAAQRTANALAAFYRLPYYVITDADRFRVVRKLPADHDPVYTASPAQPAQPTPAVG